MEVQVQIDDISSPSHNERDYIFSNFLITLAESVLIDFTITYTKDPDHPQICWAVVDHRPEVF